MHAQLNDDELRDATAGQLEALARLIRIGQVPGWQLERIAGDSARELEIADKVGHARAAEAYAYQSRGANWVVAFPCGCRREQRPDGVLVSRGFCPAHRAEVTTSGGPADAPRPQGGLLSTLRRVK